MKYYKENFESSNEVDENVSFTKSNANQNRCIGCGKTLQSFNQKLPGYVLDPTKQEYCLRCFKIKNYNRLVEQEINDKDFIEILDNINKTTDKIRYYYVVDVFDLPGSQLPWLEKLIHEKEVVILVNKIDLLPKIMSEAKIMNYLINYFDKTSLKGSKIILTSAFKKNYIMKLLNEFKSVEYDQYIIGVSNAGKSSLINASLEMNNQRPTIVSSKYVNTTLDKIKINFTDNNAIYDTPGLVKHNHVAISSDTTFWDFFFFKKEIKQFTFQLIPGQTVFYGGIAWLTFENTFNTPEESKSHKSSFHFWTNRNFKLHRTKETNTKMYFLKNRHSLAPRPKDVEIEFEKHNFIFEKEQEVDIHISGLGWVSVKTFPGMKLTVSVPKVKYGIKVSLMPKMI